jgi:hypothetical protein
MRGVLIGLEQEPVVVFSIALGFVACGVALVVPPVRKSLGGQVVSYNTGDFPAPTKTQKD